MDPSHKVLVVAQDTRLAMTLVSLLRESGCEPAVTTSYSAGRDQLDAGPAFVIAEVRLGAYNGLHLALKARAKGIPGGCASATRIQPPNAKPDRLEPRISVRMIWRRPNCSPSSVRRSGRCQL